MVIYLLVIVILYWRVYGYRKLIDDAVPRDGYLYEGPRRVDPGFYQEGRGLVAFLTNLGVFMGVCGYIDHMWGWRAALLYAVYPMNVVGVAWVTGNYYMSTVLLVLASHYFLQTHIWFMSLMFYAAALNSTTNALSYVFIAPMYGLPGVSLLWPFLAFLNGRRMTSGLALRKERHKNLHVESKFSWRNLVNVPKVLAYYIYISIFPMRLGFFHSWGKSREYFTAVNMFFCCLLCLEFLWVGMRVDIRMVVWWFMSMGIFCHIQGHYGQFIAERYMVLANVAWCVMLAKAVTNPVIFAVIATLYFCKSFSYIPVWRNNETLFAYSMEAQPDSPENFNNLGNYYMDMGRISDAVRPLQVAEVLSKGDKHRIYASLMRCYYSARQYGKALLYAGKALAENCPDDRYDEIQKARNDILDKIKTIKRHEKLLRREGIVV